MKIHIEKKVEMPINAYMVVIKTMYGDADGYGEIKVGPFRKGKDEEYLEDLIRTCNRLKTAYPRGRGGGDDYNHIEGFNLWFNCDNLTQEEYDVLPEQLQDLLTEWPYDPQCDGHQAGYQNYTLFFYDEHGKEYNAKVTL